MIFYEISLDNFLCGKFDYGTFSDENGDDVEYDKIPDIEAMNKELLTKLQQRDPKYPITSIRPETLDVGKAKIINNGITNSKVNIIFRCR